MYQVEMAILSRGDGKPLYWVEGTRVVVNSIELGLAPFASENKAILCIRRVVRSNRHYRRPDGVYRIRRIQKGVIYDSRNDARLYPQS